MRFSGNDFHAVKSGLKRLAAHGLYLSGTTGAYRRRVLREKAVVLMYHRVVPFRGNSLPANEGIHVDTGVFDRQMAYIRKNFQTLSLDDLGRHLRERVSFPNNSCMVTFDDGWKDNYTHAYPILKKYDVPAVIFLSVGYIGTKKRFWQERFFTALSNIRATSWKTGKLPEPQRDVLGKYRIDGFLNLDEIRFRAAARAHVQTLKSMPLKHIEPIVEELESVAGFSGNQENGDGDFLSWEEVAEMARGGIEFGSHGMNHEIMTNISREEISKEVHASREVIEAKIPVKVSAFSYPNGNHDPVVRRCLRECGYDIAFDTRRGYVGLESDPLSLNRVNIHNDMTSEIPMFLARIIGIL